MARVEPMESLSLPIPGQGGSTSRSLNEIHSPNSYTNPAFWDTARTEDLEATANEDLAMARFSRGSKSQKAREEQLEEHQRVLKRFIRANFHRKECNLFDAKDGSKCACGESRDKHDNQVLETGPHSGKWNEAACLVKVDGPTNAFGRITLKNEGFDNRDPIHFVRLCDEDDMEKILELMKTHWHMVDPQKPSLCVSVIGGAKNFKLEGRKKEVFHHGLIRAAQTTNAWIITSGLNLGITRVVGNALEEGRASHWEKSSKSSKLRCIGVAPWGYVLNREDLINKADPKTGELSLNVEYKISNVISRGQPVSLNANHTHYLLVDDGKRNRYGGSKSGVVKAKLQAQINEKEQIPVVLLIVEGGLDIFEETQSMIQANVPVVTCDNTGRAADIIAFAFKKVQKAEKEKLTEAQTQDLRDQMVAAFKDSLLDQKTDVLDVDKLEKNLKMLLEIVQNRKLITVFDMNRSDDLDLAILSALLKAMDAKKHEDDNQKQLELYKQQLELSITWDRPDIAAEKIFTEELQWGTEDLRDLTRQAIVQEKIEFVRLFLKNGLIMREFLSVATMRSLYWDCLRATNNSQGSVQVRKLLAARTRCKQELQQQQPRLSDIRVLLRKLLGKFQEKIMEEDKEMEDADQSVVDAKQREVDAKQFDRPFNQLFLWAVLFCRQETAKFLWERTDEAVPLALAACKIYEEMARALSSHEDERKATLQAYKNEFEELAVRVIDECQSVDSAKADSLIENPVESFGRFNCLELAASASCKKFMSCNSCQNSVNSRWLNGLLHGTSNIRIFFCVLLPFLLPFNIIRVETDNRDPEKSRCTSLCKKVKIFYTAPVTKFFANAIFYILFVFLYSWFILFEMHQASVSWLEAVIMAWICVMVAEEGREMFSSKAEALDEKVRDWWGFSVWNRLDIFTLVLALIAMFLRIPASTDNIIVAIRTCYILAGVLFYLRVFRLYYVNSYLGPKLVMIQKMVTQLLFYMSILLIALFTYGVAAQALLYPNRDFYPMIFADIVYYPYWQIYGEIYLDFANAVKPTGCDGNSTVDLTGKACPTYHALVLLLLAIYLLVVNVLLINLLIAIFSNIFKDIQQNSIQIWKFNLYFLVQEYHTRPILAVPFVIIEDAVRLIRFICCRLLPCCQKAQDVSQNKQNLPSEINSSVTQEDLQLRSFVSHCVSQVQSKQEVQAKGQIEYRIQNIYGGLDELYKMCDRIDERFDDERQPARTEQPKVASPRPAAAPAAATAAVPPAPAVVDKKAPASVNEDVEDEKPRPSGKNLSLTPIEGPNAGNTAAEKPSPTAAIADARNAAEAAAEAEVLERKRQKKLRKKEEKEERRRRRRSRSRRRAEEAMGGAEEAAVAPQEPPGAAGFAYQALNDFNITAEGADLERLMDMERRLRNMETATTDSLSSIEKLLRQILMDKAKPDYARLQ